MRVDDTDAQSYVSRSVADVFVNAKEEKKRKYRLAAEARHASFSPFVIYVDGALGKEAALFLGRITDQLSVTWGRSYGNVLGWLKACLGFAVIRATNICLRGSHVAWRSGAGIDDGAALPDVLPMHHQVKIFQSSVNFSIVFAFISDCRK